MSPSKFADEASHDAEIKVPPGETDFGERALAVVGQRGDLACRVIAIDHGFSGQRRPRPPHCDSTFDQAVCERRPPPRIVIFTLRRSEALRVGNERVHMCEYSV